MAFGKGQFDIVKPIQDFQYQFECSTYDWNDSFLHGGKYVRLLDTLKYNQVVLSMFS